MDRQKTKLIRAGVLMVILGLALVQCSWFKKKEVQTINLPVRETTKVEEKSITPSVNTVEADEALSAGELTKAFSLYQNLAAQHPGNEKVLAGWEQSAELIKKRADDQRKKGNYSAALVDYRLLADNFSLLEQSGRPLRFNQEEIASALEACQVLALIAEINKVTQKGQVDKALDLSFKGWKEHQPGHEFKTLYFNLLNNLKKQADQDLASGKMDLAGKEFYALKMYKNKHKALASEAPFSLEEIEKSIKICSQDLTNRGLMEYRNGKLKEAIATWEKVLTFDPENEEVKKALQTARTQLEKIKH